MIHFFLHLKRQFNLLGHGWFRFTRNCSLFEGRSSYRVYDEPLLWLSRLCFLVLPFLCLFCVYPQPGRQHGMVDSVYRARRVEPFHPKS